MGFGRVTKYWRISLNDIKNTSFLRDLVHEETEHQDEDHITLDAGRLNRNNSDMLIKAWDDAVEFASGKYQYEDHNLITNNCHAHVATALNRLHFRNITYWNTVLIMIYLMIYGKFVRYAACKTFATVPVSRVCVLCLMPVSPAIL